MGNAVVPGNTSFGRSRRTVHSCASDPTYNSYYIVPGMDYTYYCTYLAYFKTDFTPVQFFAGRTYKKRILVLYSTAGRPGSSEVPRNPLTRWDVSSTRQTGFFSLKN